MSEVCPFYVDLLADAQRLQVGPCRVQSLALLACRALGSWLTFAAALQAVVDRLKNLSQTATLTTTKQARRAWGRLRCAAGAA